MTSSAAAHIAAGIFGALDVADIMLAVCMAEIDIEILVDAFKERLLGEHMVLAVYMGLIPCLVDIPQEVGLILIDIVF